MVSKTILLFYIFDRESSPSNRLQITLGRVLKAALIFKGIMIEWVTVKGFDESFDDVDDLWSESRHHVFRKLQDHTHSAMLHFFSPTLPELAVKSFMASANVEIQIWRVRTKLWFHYSVDMAAQLCETVQRTVPEMWKSPGEHVSADVERSSYPRAVAWRV